MDDLQQEIIKLNGIIDTLKHQIKLYEISTKLDYEKIEKLTEKNNKISKKKSNI